MNAHGGGREPGLLNQRENEMERVTPAEMHYSEGVTAFLLMMRMEMHCRHVDADIAKLN